MIIERIKALSDAYFDEIKSYRRHIHANPELSFEEYKTADFIEAKLREWGITQITRMANTGVIALIESNKKSDKIFALRADIDALPIQEVEGREYGSKNPGIMHACGHDVHSSSLLGAVKILNELKDHWSGKLKIIFQPGEELVPGGASILIKEGVLENPSPQGIIGQHVMPLLPVGTVGFRKGLYMASADEIYLKVKSKGGHGAMPHMTVDTVLVTSHIIVACQQLISRMGNPAIPSVLSFGKVIANGATNVIPSEVYVEGTFRTFDEKWRYESHDKLRKLIEGIGESMGAEIELEIRKGYPFLKNDVELTERAKNNAIEYLGADKVVDLDLWMASEDFAFYSQKIPASFYRLGVRNEERGITHSVHTPGFDIDEEALKTGMGLMAYLAIQELV